MPTHLFFDFSAQAWQGEEEEAERQRSSFVFKADKPGTLGKSKGGEEVGGEEEERE
jgi:hypothetical protein